MAFKNIFVKGLVVATGELQSQYASILIPMLALH